MALARALAVEPKVLLLESPFGALDARVRAELREWLRRLHDEVHVTTVFVTHDQEEAMAVADQIAVMNRGRIEQVGGPRDLYEQPRTVRDEFVGPATRVGERWLRPHDLDLLLDPAEGAIEAMVRRIVHLGFEVRVDLVRADGETLLGPADARPLRGARARGGADRLRPPSHERVFADPLGSTRARDEVGERRLLEHAAHAGAELDPDVPEPRGGRCSATSSGRLPRTVAIGPSTARMTSAS
jgi:hypothetical protein